MIIFYAQDGAQTMVHGEDLETPETRTLVYSSYRIVVLYADGSIHLVKNRCGAARGQILSPMPRVKS